MNILGVVPARGGSKGIPKKNLQKINNQSLTFLACKFAKSIDWITDAICSSDDSLILQEAHNAGVNTPFLGQKNYRDFVGDMDVLRDA